VSSDKSLGTNRERSRILIMQVCGLMGGYLRWAAAFPQRLGIRSVGNQRTC